MAQVFLNGKAVGSIEDPKAFVEKFVGERRMGKIAQSLNILYDEATDFVFVEGSRGRTVRPLIVVGEGKPLLTERHIQQLQKNEISWHDLCKQGVIEYLDALEEESAFVAFSQDDLTPEHTHMEISPMVIIGLTTSLVPFGNFNHSVRLMQGSKNQKHAIGFYATNFFTRIDMDVNLLHYPQIPLVSTITQDFEQFEKHPAGQNVIIAVMSYGGYNMEDAIILNKGSVERGLARSSYYRPISSEELRYSGGLMDEISLPDKDVKGYRTEHEYRFLEDDGLIYPEAKVEEGDVIIGKTSPPRFLSSFDEYNLASSSRREASTALKHGEQGIIDMVFLTENREGNKLVQARIRDLKIPEIGDKFTSRHGQKGVVGMLVPEEDIPFTARGMKPDLIFSPHGVPTRMTVSHLLEILGGKVAALSGRFVDATIFSAESEEDLRKELEKMGFRENGAETLYNGITGQKYRAKIFMGNTYYLRLKHLVSNKMHSRARGPIQLLTRQPTEGRAKEGGLRLGEMEKDTFVAHGASLLLKERFDADRTTVPICVKSGLIGYYNAKTRKAVSPMYGEDAELVDVEVSYAFKLFLDELRSLGVYPKLLVESKFKAFSKKEEPKP